MNGVDANQPQQEAMAVIEMCRSALAEELSAWDIDPPLHHVKQAHDACVEWLTHPPTIGHSTLEGNHLQAVDDAMVERACVAFYLDPQDGAVGWHNLLKENAMRDLIRRTREAMRAALTAALAAHGKGG